MEINHSGSFSLDSQVPLKSHLDSTIVTELSHLLSLLSQKSDTQTHAIHSTEEVALPENQRNLNQLNVSDQDSEAITKMIEQLKSHVNQIHNEQSQNAESTNDLCTQSIETRKVIEKNVKPKFEKAESPFRNKDSKVSFFCLFFVCVYFTCPFFVINDNVYIITFHTWAINYPLHVYTLFCYRVLSTYSKTILGIQILSQKTGQKISPNKNFPRMTISKPKKIV